VRSKDSERIRNLAVLSLSIDFARAELEDRPERGRNNAIRRDRRIAL
jgi:hypothetical protein